MKRLLHFLTLSVVLPATFIPLPAPAGTAPQPGTPGAERDVLEQCLAPEAVFRYDHDFPMDLEDGGGDYSMHEYRAFLPLPPVVTDTFMMISSVNYRVFDADISTGVMSGRFDLHSLRMPMQFGWLSPSSPWVGIVYLEPGLATDFNVINSDSFDLNAGIGAGYRFSDNFFAALGVGHSRNYGEDDIFPAIVLLWRPCEAFTLMVSPDGIEPKWEISDDWRLRMKLELIGGRWTLEDEGQSREVRLKGGTAGLFLEHRLFEQCWLSIGAGVNTQAELRVEDGSGNELLDSGLEDAFVLRSGLKWVF